MRSALVTQAVVLVGGRGTRLGTLTDRIPKPMLPVGRRPFLEYLLLQLKSQEIENVLLCLGYLPQTFQDYFGDGRELGLHIRYSVESEPAGTGGPLVLARAELEEQFFVLNGDTIFDVPLQLLAEKLQTNSNAVGTIALRKINDVSRYGRVELDGDHISRFNEKGGAGPGLINGGIYCLRNVAIDLLPRPPCSIEKNLFPMLAERHQLVGVSFDNYFIDIGLPETLQQAEKELPPWLENLNVVRDPS